MSRRPTSRQTGTFVATVAALAAAGVLVGPLFLMVATGALAVGAMRDDWGMVYGALVGFLVGAGTCFATF